MSWSKPTLLQHLDQLVTDATVNNLKLAMRGVSYILDLPGDGTTCSDLVIRGGSAK